MTTITTGTPSRLSMRTIGPVLMIVFGLVLLLGPLASVGSQGSVGNAGAVIPKGPECPPDGGGAAGGAAFVGPDEDDCPTPTTTAPTTAAPTTAAPTTVAPSDGDQGGTPGGVEIGGPAPAPSDEPEVQGLVVEQPASTTEGSGAAVEAPAAPAEQPTELALTGPRENAIASIIGVLLVLSGAGLLIASRRRLA